jgi:hypothetical protein
MRSTVAVKALILVALLYAATGSAALFPHRVLVDDVSFCRNKCEEKHQHGTNNALAGSRNTILTSHNALSRPEMSLMHVSVLASTATLLQT